MRKEQALQHWEQLESNQPILPHFTPIPYKARGSNYGACGIRIDGNPAFVDAVLSRLQDLIAGENGVTRLGLARNEVKQEVMGKHFPAGGGDAEVCYIRLHVRGGDAQMVAGLFDKRLNARTEQFAEAIGVSVDAL